MAEYINREKILEDIGTDIAAFTLSMVFRHIRNAPPADVAEVKHGKWEWFEEKHGTPIDGYDYDWGWHCSNCKAELSDDYDDPDTPPKMRYCPNCGAKMGAEG